MSFKPKVALAQDFLVNLATLSASVQGKVLKWALRFQSDPTSNGINYEPIKQARDKNLKSVRIDQDWRGIVFKPPAGDVYVLMYVDHHDAAYKWAEGAGLRSIQRLAHYRYSPSRVWSNPHWSRSAPG